jgi:hypothetical protein
MGTEFKSFLKGLLNKVILFKNKNNLKIYIFFK